MMHGVTQSNEDESCRAACTDPVSFLQTQCRDTEKATIAVMHLRDFKDHIALQKIVEAEYEPLLNRHLALAECYEGKLYQCQKDYNFLEVVALNPESPRSLALAAMRYMLQVFYDEVPSGTLQYIIKHDGEIDLGETDSDRVNNALYSRWVEERFPQLVRSELISIKGPTTLAPLRIEDQHSEDLDFTKVQLAAPIDSKDKALRSLVASILDEALGESARTLASTILHSCINPRYNPEHHSLVEEDIPQLEAIFDVDNTTPIFSESFRFAVAKSIGCISGAAPFAAARLCAKIATTDKSVAVKEAARLSFADLCERINQRYAIWFEDPRRGERAYSDTTVIGLEEIQDFLYLRHDSNSFLSK